MFEDDDEQLNLFKHDEVEGNLGIIAGVFLITIAVIVGTYWYFG